MINIPQFSVSEFSRSIKRVVEDAFGYVKIKGEISGIKRATSGHFYFNLKDQEAVLSAVFFRNMAQLVNFEIGDGLEVIASGKITTFEGRSNYQIIVEKLEIAGIGAILEMIEKRRQKLLAEGLFDEINKKPIPFFPQKIGVITSPTGSVIEDIKHRILARCPSHVMLFEVAVQGERAANEVASGIRFFNRLAIDKRPQVLIIARGGGSIEDLMAFNDENLVREVFKSEIPIISAIGHETDTTLIDYVSDLRAPTPSAAAELATPTLSELKNQVSFLSQKLQILPQNFLSQNSEHLKNLQKYIVKPEQKISEISQIFNLIEQRFTFLAHNFLDKKTQKITSLQISSEHFLQKINLENRTIEFLLNRSKMIAENRFKEEKNKIENLEKIMSSNHYDRVLERGFVMLKNKNGHLISSILETSINEEILIEMHQGKIEATINSKTII